MGTRDAAVRNAANALYIEATDLYKSVIFG